MAHWFLQRTKFETADGTVFAQNPTAVIALDGTGYLLTHLHEIKIFGVPKLMVMEMGMTDLWAVSAENGALYKFCTKDYTAEVRMRIDSRREVKMTLVQQFFGLKIRRISSLHNTAILTTTGSVFLTGPTFDHFPAPPMVIFPRTDDKVVELAISFNMLIMVTSNGRLYRTYLERFWDEPALIYDDLAAPIKTVRFCGNRTFLAISRLGQLFLWQELPIPGTNRIDSVYPPSSLEMCTKPTPVAVPWKVESADYFVDKLAIASERRFSYNAIFADFLNRAALNVVRDSAAMSSGMSQDRLIIDEPVNFMKLSNSERYQKDYQLYDLQAYGMSDYGGSTRSLHLSGITAYSSPNGTSTPSSPRPSDLLASTLTGYYMNSSLGIPDMRASSGSYVYGRGSSNRAHLARSMRRAAPRSLKISTKSYPSISAYSDEPVSDLGESTTSPTKGAVSSSSLSSTLDDSNHSTPYFEDESTMYSFNARLLDVYDMPATNKDEELSKTMAFCKLYDDFLARSLEIVKVIIEELALEDEHKTFSSLPSAGGVAGGEKYLIDGNIFVKLCVDNNSLYGGNEWSSKIANLELHGSDAYAWCLPLLPRGHKLRVPLLAMIDYGGFRALVSIACPISKRTIVYGSNDAANTVHNEDEEADRCMQQCAFLLNLAPHQVKNGGSKLMASAVDVEVHRGDDGYLYILDTARVFPPVAPGASKSIVLGHSLSEDLFASRDLSQAQSRSLRRDLDSVPLSEGQLFFRRTKASVAEDDISALRPAFLESERARLQNERDEMGLDMDVPLDSNRRFAERLESLRGPLNQSGEEPEFQDRIYTDPQSGLPTVDRVAAFEASPDDTFVNHVATALLGRLVLGEAWFLANETGQRLWHQFRPEFVIGYHTALSSDALSAFAVNGEGHDESVKKATDFLDQAYMLFLKRQLNDATPYMNKQFLHGDKRAEKAEKSKSALTRIMPLIYSPATLVRFMHNIGLNIRHIGLVRSTTTVRALLDICLMEMVSRVCTSFIKRRLRAAHSLFSTVQYYVAHGRSPGTSSKTGDAEPSSSSVDPNLASSSAPSPAPGASSSSKGANSRHRNATGDLADWDKLTEEEIMQLANKTLDEIRSVLAIQAYTTIFAHTATASFFWTQVIKIQILLKFGGSSLSPDEMPKWHDLRDHVHFATLFQTVSRRTGVIWDAASQRELEVAQWSSLPFELTADRIVGYGLSSKGSRSSSLAEAKRDLLAQFFPDTVQVPLPLPEPYENLPELSIEPLYRQFFEDSRSYLARPVQPIDDPLFITTIDNSESHLLEEPQPSTKVDGLDTFHRQIINFYEKWCAKLVEAGLEVPVLDQVRLLVARIRPVLDAKCPGGEEDFNFVENSLKSILSLMKEREVSHLNCELLSNIYYARGQYHHLKGELREAELSYLAALDVLIVPTYTESTLSLHSSENVTRSAFSLTNVMRGSGTKSVADWTYVARRSLPHPMSLLIVDKLLSIHVEHTGTIFYAYPYWSMFRATWNMCPFLGDSEAKKRIFNGHSLPLAFIHPHEWEFAWRVFEKTPDSTAHEPWLAHLRESLFTLESPEVQFWLSQVLELESSCSYEYSSQWILSGDIDNGLADFGVFGQIPPITDSPQGASPLQSSILHSKSDDIPEDEIDAMLASSSAPPPHSPPSTSSPSSSNVPSSSSAPSSQPEASRDPQAPSSETNYSPKNSVLLPFFPHQMKYLAPATAFPHFSSEASFTPRVNFPSWYSFLAPHANSGEDAWAWFSHSNGNKTLLTEFLRLSGSSELKPIVRGEVALTPRWVPKETFYSYSRNILLAAFRQRYGADNMTLGRYHTLETGLSRDSPEQLDLLKSMHGRIKRVRQSIRDSLPPDMVDDIFSDYTSINRNSFDESAAMTQAIFSDELQNHALAMQIEYQEEPERSTPEDRRTDFKTPSTSKSAEIEGKGSSSMPTATSSELTSLSAKKDPTTLVRGLSSNKYWHGLTAQFYLSVGARTDINGTITSSLNRITTNDFFGTQPFAQVQYLDPSLPPPRRYLVSIWDRPEMYSICALPRWFDERGVRSFDVYHYGYSNGGTNFDSSPFLCITRDYELTFSVDLAGREPSESDWKAMKAFDLAGEQISSIAISAPERMVPSQNASINDLGDMKDLERMKRIIRRTWSSYNDILAKHADRSVAKVGDNPERERLDLAHMATIACVTRSGRLFVWGGNKRGLLGFGSSAPEVYEHPRVVASLFHQHIIDAKCGVGHIITLSKQGQMHFWGNILPLYPKAYFSDQALKGYSKIHMDYNRPAEKDLPMFYDLFPQTAVCIASSAYGITAISHLGIAYYFGLMALNYITPDWTRIIVPERIVSAASGHWHTVLLGESGRVYAWGYNGEGQCGTPLPAFFIDGTDRCLKAIEFDWYRQGFSAQPTFVQIAAVGLRSAALTSTGELWLWGGIQYGSPFRVPTPAPIKDMSFTHDGKLLLITEDMPEVHQTILPLMPIKEFEDLVLNFETLANEKRRVDHDNEVRMTSQQEYEKDFKERMRRELEADWKERNKVADKMPTPVKTQGVPQHSSSSLDAHSSSSSSAPSNVPGEETEAEIDAISESSRQSVAQPSTSGARPPEQFNGPASVIESEWQVSRVAGAIIDVGALVPAQPIASDPMLLQDSGLMNAIRHMISTALEPVSRRLGEIEDRLRKLETRKQSGAER